MSTQSLRNSRRGSGLCQVQALLGDFSSSAKTIGGVIETLIEFDNAVILPRPLLRISYDADRDFLWALVPGEVLDGQLDDETEPVVTLDDDDGDMHVVVWLYRRGPDGPLIGFGVADAWDTAWDSDDLVDLWSGPRFDVPSLALRDAAIGEILLAARRSLFGSTPDIVYFNLAVREGERGNRESAERYWRACLAAGEMKAHYGLGYTLVELGRPREAFGYLAMYTEINPRNSWAWYWRARAAEDMGELAEAIVSYERAISAEEAGSYETDAPERLAALRGEAT